MHWQRTEALVRQVSGRTRLMVHENWRWQTPIRALKAVLDGGSVGRVFRARLTMVSGFDLFANQPFLAELEQFVLTDVGSHVLDVARFLFGEAEAVHCRTVFSFLPRFFPQKRTSALAKPYPGSVRGRSSCSATHAAVS